MATSIRQFNVALYREHLDEASFLYDQRREYLVDPELSWPDLHQWEERFEAHLDALVLGGELARDVCLQRVAGGDHGELHAAVRVLCLQNRKAEVFSILGALDDTNEAAVRAVTEALCRETTSRWQEDLARELHKSQQHVTRILARVIGYRRFPLEADLQARLEATPATGRAELAWALGRVGTTKSVNSLWPLLGEDDEAVQEASAIALMRLGDERPLSIAAHAAPTQAWARRVLGIAGNKASVPALLELLTNGTGHTDAVFALGLLGDLSAVAPLLALLEHEELSESAAVALNTITGAELHQTVFVPDRIEPDELSHDERVPYDRDGTVPTRGGRPYGNHERRPLLDRAGWRSWLDANKHRFNRRDRWRMGRPHGPAAAFQCLRNATTPYAVRAATYEELVIRFGLDIPFEVDLPVSQQLRLLQNIERWAAEREDLLTDGA